MSRLTPADVVSIESNAVSYLFYVNSKGIISSLKGHAKGEESEAAGFYTKEAVNLVKSEDGSETVSPIKTHPDLKQIAAVAYQDAEGYQIRIYYAEDGSLKLKEACRTNGGKWFVGALGRTTAIKMPKGSSISANVHKSSNKLKVFACDDNDENEDGNMEMSCFYSVLGSGDWTRRRITQDVKY